MKTYLSIIISLFALCQPAFSIIAVKVSGNDGSAVKSITAWKQETPNSTSGIMISYTEYNNKGNKVIAESYNSDGSLSERITYEYNNAGNVIEEVIYKLPSNEKAPVFLFDKNESKKESLKLADLLISSRNKMTYDEKGNKTEEVRYNADEKIINRFIFVFTQEGKLLLEIKTDPDSVISSKKQYNYDTNGNLTKATTLLYYSVNSTKSFKYDKNNNKIEEKFNTSGDEFNGQIADDNTFQLNIVNADGSTFSRTTYKYNEKAEQIEKTAYNVDGSIIQKLAFKFDDKGNKIETKEYRDHETIYAISRNKFDARGNLLEATEMQSFLGSSNYMEYEYNDNDKLSKQIWYSQDKRGNETITNKETITYSYNEKGNLIKTSYENTDGSPGNKKTYLYNVADKLIEEVWFFEESTNNSKKIFKYDDKGNKIKEETFDVLNGKPEAIIYTYEFF